MFDISEIEPKDFKFKFEPCLCVLNITSWRGISIGADHYYGKLLFVEQNTDPDYGKITIENIDNWLPNSIDFEVKQPLTLEMAKRLDIKYQSNGTYVSSFKLHEHGKKTYINQFDSIDEINECAIKIFKMFGLEIDFISLYEMQKFSKTLIIKRSADIRNKVLKK